jgi:hypothetical protein
MSDNIVVDLITPPASPKSLVPVMDLTTLPESPKSPVPVAPMPAVPAEPTPAVPAAAAVARRTSVRGKAVKVIPGPIRKTANKAPAPRVPLASTMLRAIDTGNRGLFDEVIRRGADINQVTTINKVRITPLIAAINAGEFDMVKALIEAGADPHWPESGKYSAMTVATKLNNPKYDIRSKLIGFIRSHEASKEGINAPLNASADAGGLEMLAEVVAREAPVAVGDGASGAAPLSLPEGSYMCSLDEYGTYRYKGGNLCILTRVPDPKVPEMDSNGAAGGTGAAFDMEEANGAAGGTGAAYDNEDDDEEDVGSPHGSETGEGNGEVPVIVDWYRAYRNDKGEWVAKPDGPWIVYVNSDLQPVHCPALNEERKGIPTSPKWDEDQ